MTLQYHCNKQTIRIHQIALIVTM